MEHVHLFIVLQAALETTFSKVANATLDLVVLLMLLPSLLTSLILVVP